MQSAKSVNGVARLTLRKRGRPPTPGLADARREQILATATSLFARNGYDRTDLQQVADELKIGKGTVYRYGSSKRELFLAAADRAMRQLRVAIDAAADAEPEPLARIRTAIRAYLEFFEAHPEYVELLIQERAAFRDRKKPTYFAHREANIERWRELYRGLIAAGIVRDIPVDRITDTLSGLVYGTMFSNFFLRTEKAAQKQADDIIDIVFNGILTRPAGGDQK
jgi:AcrR family transcriptional regulator